MKTFLEYDLSNKMDRHDHHMALNAKKYFSALKELAERLKVNDEASKIVKEVLKEYELRLIINTEQ